MNPYRDPAQVTPQYYEPPKAPTFPALDELDPFEAIDKRCPAWVQQPTQKIEALQLVGLTPEGIPCGVRSMMLRFKGHPLLDSDIRPDGMVEREFVMPYQPYVRAIDPAGNLAPLTVATTREDEDRKEGAYEDVKKARKRAAGWLIAEPDEYSHAQDPVASRGQVEYMQYCLREMARRRRARAEQASREEELFKPNLEKALERNNNRMLEVIERISADNREQLMTLLQALAAKPAETEKPKK